VSKARCVQSFGGDSAAFVPVFALAFPAALASTGVSAAAAAFPAVPASAFVFVR
jgi:hypothetical protein